MGLGGSLARVSRRQERKLERQRRRSARLRWQTRLLGVLSVSAVAVLIGAEAVRVWRLGKLPRTHGDEQEGRSAPIDTVLAIRDGYRVSSTRENAIVNMVASFIVALAVTRAITHTIRVRGGIGPIKNIETGRWHIHHFIPGAVISLIAGGVAIGLRPEGPNRWLAIPFGTGIALVLDEAALLLELEDVYWSEEGVLSVRISFAVMGLLGAVAYAIQVRRRGQPGTELDWTTAAKAWRDLETMPGGSGRGGIGPSG